MVRLTDAIAKVQGNQVATQPRRPRSTSQSRQSQETAVGGAASQKQAPVNITGDKLSLNYQEISSLAIDRQGFSVTQQKALAFQFAKVKKLFLSHNNLTSLEGIAHFPNLTHLSLSNNRLANIEELAKIGSASTAHGTANNSSKLLCLAVKGNYFLERHPDYKALIIRHFVNLRELDSQPLQAGPHQVSLRAQVREGTHLKHSVIPLLLKIDRSIQLLASHLDSGTTNFEKIELIQRWNQLFNQKDYQQRGKIPQKVVQAAQLRGLLKQIDSTVLSDSSCMKVQSSQLHDLFEWLYQEIILKLSQELKSTDLVKYLNFTILQKYPQLADFLNVKYTIDPSKQLHQLDQRQVERLCSLLERDNQISLEMLLAEQLNVFYELQPEISTVQDYSGDIKGAIEIVPEATQHLSKQDDSSPFFNQTAPVPLTVKEPAGTPSPNTNTQRKKLLVENSGSSFDHPIVLKTQKELLDRSLTKGGDENEVEFSFREKQSGPQDGKPPSGLQKFSPIQQDGKEANEQSFLVQSKEKHHDSPVRRTTSPAMKSFFKIKQSAETEILPARPPSTLQDNQPILADMHNQKVAALKMNIPKNYFNQGPPTDSHTGDNSNLGHQSKTVSESFQLSSNDPIHAARCQYEAQPEQTALTTQGKQVLAKFLEDQTDREALQQTKAFLKDKILMQFPIFALNEDYMRAIALIIMDKIERAQNLVRQLSVQIYPAQDESSVLEQPIEGKPTSSVQQKCPSRKQLTSAEKQKLSLIKRKLQEKKDSRSRSVTFDDSRQASSTGRQQNRSQSKGSNNSRDSCFSPVNRRRTTVAVQQRSLSRKSDRSGGAGKSQDQRIFGSELLREQTIEHQRLTDEQNAELWIKKKQIRSKFASKMKKIALMLDLVEQRTIQQAYYHWLRFAQRMHRLEHQVRIKSQTTQKEKAFLFWMAAYRQSVELTSGLRDLQTKQKIWYQLDINRKQARLNQAKVDTYCRQKLLLKSFYGFLKVLEQRREDKRNVQNHYQRNQESPPQIQQQPTNIYKRQSSKKKEENSLSSALGLVNVRPVIDKKLDGVYDLDVVDIKRRSSKTNTTDSRVAVYHQPLLNAVRSQPILTLDQQDQTTEEGVYRCENTAYTNEPVYHQSTNMSQTKQSSAAGSAYFTKQVNFFKAGNSRSFVQQKANTTVATIPAKRSEKSRNRSRSTSRERSLNASKRSILKKVYGGESTSQSQSQSTSTLRWGNTTTFRVTNENTIMPQTGAGGVTSDENTLMDHSFGKLMADRARSGMSGSVTVPQNESSSYIDFQDKGAQTSINCSVEQSKSQYPQGYGPAQLLPGCSIFLTGKTPLKSQALQKTAPITTETLTLWLSHKIGGAKSYTTSQGRTKVGTSRVSGGVRNSVGSLSRSIQDQPPKGYEKATACYVSKVMDVQPKTSSSQMFKHLKNTTMGGYGDFFKNASGTGASASTKKQYRKMLVK